MAIRRKIPVRPGEFKDAELIEVQQSSEQWNQYLLADGSVVKLKVVVTEVWRIDNEYDNDGNPVYLVRSRNVVTVSSPEELRRPPQ